MKWTGRYQGYQLSSLRQDLIAGSIVGIVAIPLGMAFSIASGVKPEYGLYTTIIAGILIALFGGSRFQIGGPTGAFIPILLAIVMQYGYQNLLIAGFMAGFFLILMGIFKIGTLIKYIPKPVTIGFTAGIAVTIFTGQIASFLGLTGMKRHEDFLSNMREIGLRLPSINFYSVITACLCLAALLLTPKILPKIPGSLVGLLISTLAAAWLFPGQVATIGSTYGPISGGWPQFHWLPISLDQIVNLIQPALIIAMLGSIESLLSAVVADGMTGVRHNSNRELIGQGIANMAAPLFGGIPATGAIARTATNIKNGAVSPISGVVHGFIVLLVVLLFAPYASHIPLASMAPILMMVAWNMSERKSFTHMLRTKTGDSFILVVTFLLTVLTTLTTAVEAGLALAVAMFFFQMSRSLKVDKVLPDPTLKNKIMPHMVSEDHDCPQVEIYNMEGPLFFGVTGSLENSKLRLGEASDLKVLILRMGKVPFMDTTGEANFAAIVREYINLGVLVVVVGLRPQPLSLIKRTGTWDLIGAERAFEHVDEALSFALNQVNSSHCLGCKHLAFRECPVLSSAESPLRTPGSLQGSFQQ
ncbi:sodium-independent anion transporter [Paenibacillus sp. CAA11]|uniref:SulP family inorganic anion transporter n=1 Tax=Paenibacillus sp. CAA11 TaxID=1532905 RepID=UPI000D369370|nr:SulP family inorganic anion transporter [Paenibacillus sp. CAA11]AWB43718.1 sodium-independent anion transporter [Paenibacillus sp. CAA11]